MENVKTELDNMRAEGEMLLDIYETLSRDRLKRGHAPLKLILFANAEEISTHITNTLEKDIEKDLDILIMQYDNVAWEDH